MTHDIGLSYYHTIDLTIKAAATLGSKKDQEINLLISG
jgi:hypothetical protein